MMKATRTTIKLCVGNGSTDTPFMLAGKHNTAQGNYSAQ